MTPGRLPGNAPPMQPPKTCNYTASNSASLWLPFPLSNLSISRPSSSVTGLLHISGKPWVAVRCWPRVVPRDHKSTRAFARLPAHDTSGAMSMRPSVGKSQHRGRGLMSAAGRVQGQGDSGQQARKPHNPNRLASKDTHGSKQAQPSRSRQHHPRRNPDHSGQTPAEGCRIAKSSSGRRKWSDKASMPASFPPSQPHPETPTLKTIHSTRYKARHRPPLPPARHQARQPDPVVGE